MILWERSHMLSKGMEVFRLSKAPSKSEFQPVAKRVQICVPDVEIRAQISVFPVGVDGYFQSHAEIIRHRVAVLRMWEGSGGSAT